MGDGAVLGDKLLKVMTSSFQRPNPKGFKIHAKATGHYVNSILASQEAKTKVMMKHCNRYEWFCC